MSNSGTPETLAGNVYPVPGPRPYRLTQYLGNGVTGTVMRFATFAGALRAYGNLACETKQLLNDDRRDEGTTGLTDEELDRLFTLPLGRVATEAELAAALEGLS